MPPKPTVKSNSHGIALPSSVPCSRQSIHQSIHGSPAPKPIGKPTTTNTSGPSPKKSSTDSLYWPAKCKQLDINLQHLSDQVSALRNQLVDGDGRALNLQDLSQQIHAFRQQSVELRVAQDCRESNDKVTILAGGCAGLESMQRIDQESLSATCEDLCSKWWTDKGERLKKLECEIETLLADARGNRHHTGGKTVVDDFGKQQQDRSRSLDEVMDERLPMLEAKLVALVGQSVANQTSSLQALAKRIVFVDEASEARFSKLEAFVDQAVAKQTSSLDSQVHECIEQALAKRALSSDEAS